MPEGDTIHRAAEHMREVLEARVPEEILTPHPRHRADRWPERLRGRAVRAVEARGKHLLVRFEGDLTLHSHLRMSGLWMVCREGQRWRRAATRAWLVMRCEGWEVVEFDGPVLELMSDFRVRTDPRLATLGPDLLGEDFYRDLFLARLRRSDVTRPIGEALLDQRILAGVGNLWKAELCFAAAIDPWRTVSAVSDEEALDLVALARKLMRQSVSGGYAARPRFVYKHAGRPCSRCGTIVRRRGQGESNRTTYWCPGCQH